DLIQALHRAESQPGFGFVSLKWFRDAYLPRAGYSWAVSESSRQQALHDAIQEGVIVTSKVPNPRSPEFPVTAIRLNRASPETKAALGGQEAPAADFAPVKIPGENLSETVLRERR
ncbi:MAG: hypothetical protein ACRD2Q_11665, partial [Terriglobales bacterium]